MLNIEGKTENEELIVFTSTLDILRFNIHYFLSVHAGLCFSTTLYTGQESICAPGR